MADSLSHGQTIAGRVIHDGNGHVANAEVTLYRVQTGTATPTEAERTRTDEAGHYCFRGQFAAGTYSVRCTAFGRQAEQVVSLADNGSVEVPPLDLALGFGLVPHEYVDAQRVQQTSRAVVGKHLLMRATWSPDQPPDRIRWNAPPGAVAIEIGPFEIELMFARSGRARLEAFALESDTGLGPSSGAAGGRRAGGAEAYAATEIVVSEPEVQTIGGHVGVTLQRTAAEPTPDQALWVAIRNRTDAISFGHYRAFINRVLGWDRAERNRLERFAPALDRRLHDLGTHPHGIAAYKTLKTATEIFLLLECGVRVENGGRVDILEEEARLGFPTTSQDIADRLKEYLGTPPQLPYITRVVEAAFPEFERVVLARDRVLLPCRIQEPCLLELIWCYWHEEGMLMQTMNAISQRFQNVRRSADRDPLLHFEIDPLRPVNNLLWGFIQDELNRLSVGRRAYEYVHEYGLAIYGKAAPPTYAAADTRSKFLEAFHNLLHQASVFFKEDFQTTVIADGFPLLNALKEVHLILAQGAHNQFGDLPWTARAEMLVAQYILSRPEIRDFLQSRVMVPYKEAWMPQVDTMKTIQGWSDVTVTHFRDLAVFGEQLLLSIRYGDWIDVNDENAAKNWARYWRPEIQGYVHSYRAATGIDLTNPETVDATVPALLLQKRMAMQQRMR